MRPLTLFAFLTLVACKIDNPAWLVTAGDSDTDAGTGGSGTSTAGITSRPAGGSDATTSGTAGPTTGIDGTTSTTFPATSEPGTTGPDPTIGPETTTGPETTGPETTTDPETTGGNLCSFPAPLDDLELVYTSTLPVDCDPNKPRQFLAKFLGVAGPNQWKFQVCGNACSEEELQCSEPAEKEEVILTIDGPALLGPALYGGQCQHIALLPRAVNPDTPQSCLLQVLRLAHSGYTPHATHYLGAIDVPSTLQIADKITWPGMQGFEVKEHNAEPCGPDCQFPPGRYKYHLKWGMPQMMTEVLEGGFASPKFKVTGPNQNTVDLAGDFHALRARRDGSCLQSGQDFKWLWRAPLPPPP